MSHPNEKGNTVNHPEHSAEKPSYRIGLLATRRALLRGTGGSTLSHRRQLPFTRLSMPLLGVALLALLLAPSALAATSHQYLCQITGAGSASTSATECDTNPSPAENPAVPGGPLFGLNAMTADSGHLFIAEQVAGGYRTDRFDATTGAFQAQYPQANLPVADQGIAVTHATGEEQLYVSFTNTVESRSNLAVFDSAGNLLATWKGGDTPSGHFPLAFLRLAADNSSSPAAGDVYVSTSAEHVVDVFKPKPGGGEEYLTQLTGTCPSPGACAPGEVIPFSQPFNLAVDQSNGDLVVQDNSVVDIFEPTAPGKYAFLRQLTSTPAGPFSVTSAVDLKVAADAGEVYVADSHTQSVYQFDSAGKYLGQLTRTPTGPFGFIQSLAVDPASHHLFVGDTGGGPAETAAVDVFGPDLILPDVVTEPPTEVKPFEAALHGTLDPLGEGAAGCRFAWGTSAALGETLPCEPATVPDGSGPVAVHAKLSALQPDTTYFYRLQADNHNGLNEGEPFQTEKFTTPGPGIHSESASEVSATSATLEAAIDPNGAPTSYRFEYDTAPYAAGEPGHGIKVPDPDQSLGSGVGDVQVSSHLQGLAAATTYHYRVVATTALGEFAGPDRTFVTQAPGAFALPDGRAWELVSPPDKQGAQLESDAVASIALQAAADGGAVTYPAAGPTESQPQGFQNYMQVLSGRTAQGWRSLDIEIPHLEATAPGTQGEEYRLFSNDLSLGALQPFGGFNPALSTEASAQTPYLRTDFGPGNLPCTQSCYRPLVTAKPGFANVPEGTHFGPTGECSETEPNTLNGIYCGPVFEGATPDFQHLVLSSNVALTAEVPAPSPKDVIYEWTAGRLQLVSILPAAEGGTAAKGYLGALSGRDPAQRRSRSTAAVSTDGSRVVWNTLEHLYQSDLSGPQPVSVRLDQGLSGAPVFQTANSAGTEVFFTDAGSLYLYRVGFGRELLAESTPGGWPLLGASSDGSWLYFVAEQALPGVAGALAGQPNLYLRHAGSTSLVAVLSPEDGPVWAAEKETYESTARVSRNGRWLAFMSAHPLTGYDNRVVGNGRPAEEVYLYDGKTGRLRCASCDPTGARPLATECHGVTICSPLVLGLDVIWRERWVAATVPGWTLAGYQSRYLSNDGRLFFNSFGPLVPSDSNGTWDVYQYEPPQGESAPPADSCTEASSTYHPASGGCVDLISAGSGKEESGFIDASETGNDVFFYTNARLATADIDTARDLYDAHVCTAEVPCPPPEAPKPPICEGDACQQPAVPPNDPTPGSLTFQGAGNVVECPKGKVKKNGKCVAKHHKKKHPKKNHKAKKSQTKRSANNHRRASR